MVKLIGGIVEDNMRSENSRGIDWKIIISASIFICELVFFCLFLVNADYTPNSQIKILNPSFHPVRGGNWTVFFETKNTSTLSVRLADIPTINDMEFSYIACKGDKRQAEVKKDKIIVKDWNCDGQGAIIFKVKKLGNHELVFNFGKQLALAHNSSQTVYDFTASTTVTRFGYQGQDYATSVPVRVDRAVWSVASSTQFTTAQYTASNASDDSYMETSATTSVYVNFPQIVHDFEFRINEATATVTQIDYSWEGRGTQGEERATYNDLRLYVYDKAGNAFRLGDSELDSNCSGADCTMTYTTTTSIGNFFDADKDIRFVVQKYEMGHNCSSSPTTLTCGFQATTTDLVGGEVAYICAPQFGTDYWNQCDGTGATCLTGNCSGGGPVGGSAFECGFYVDDAQHNCPTCYGCSASSPTTSCTAMTTSGGSGSYGCSGECYKCSAGTCESASCEGQQCGCSGGQTCQSGVCVSLNVCQACCQANAFANGTCVFPGKCGGPPYFGNSIICGGNCPTPPQTECCCY